MKRDWQDRTWRQEIRSESIGETIMKSRILSALYASLFAFSLCTHSNTGLAATVVYGPFPGLATGITDLEFDGKFWDINFSFMQLAGNESLFPTLGDPISGLALAVAILEVLNNDGSITSVGSGVGSGANFYVIPGEIEVRPLSDVLINNEEGVHAGDGVWHLGPNVEIATTTSTSFATATLVPLPAAVWLFGSGLLGLIGVARRKKAA